MIVNCHICGKSMEAQVPPNTLKYCWFKCCDCFSAKKEVWKAERESYPPNAVEDLNLSKQDSIFVESDDFAHDVRLYIDGDFADAEQKYNYAKRLAERLNK